MLKEKKKKTQANTGLIVKKSKCESGLFYVIAMWVRTSYFVTVRLRFLICKMR